MLLVSEPGLFSTVQDAGRPGHGHLGVVRAGAADDLAMAVANLLLGNEPAAAVVEMTLLGATFEVRADVSIAIAGADMEAHVPDQGRSLAVGQSHRLRSGTTLAFGGALDGARSYLALPGGIKAEHVLGSASTDPVAGFGGIGGRPLRAGDHLQSVDDRATPAEVRRWPGHEPSSGVARGDEPRIAAVVPGPHLALMPPSFREDLADSVWTVTPRSDRVGLRLDGRPMAAAADSDLVSTPMLPGAIQVPSNGLPIVLMPDAPTIGGYPVPAVVAEVDMCVMGQLRPGDEVRFGWTEFETARLRWLRRQEWLAVVAASPS
ncbi:MAG: biotin-dependent carboxyltransferase family protein [Chloroflexota bacterium]